MKAPKTAIGVVSKTLKGKRPALVLGSQNQKDKEQRKAENGAGWHAFRGFLLLEGHSKVIESHSVRHGLREDLLQRFHGLPGAVPGTTAALICEQRYML